MLKTMEVKSCLPQPILRRTTACSRRPPASAALRLPGAAEAQRSAAEGIAEE